MDLGPASPLPAAVASLLQAIAQAELIINAVFLSLAPLQRALEHARIPVKAVLVEALLPVHALATAPLRYVIATTYFPVQILSEVLTAIKCCVPGASSGGGSGNLPGLSATQSSHARAIIQEAKNEGLGNQGCLAGIATALTEVSCAALACHGYITHTYTVEHPHLRQFQCSGLVQLPTRCRWQQLRQCRYLPAAS